MNSKVEAVPVIIDGEQGYDIRINDKEATVQDYIDAVEQFIDHQKCFRSRKPELNSCFGCDLCCQERIPVTLIDAYKLTGSGNLSETVENLLQVLVDDRVVDITMGLDETGRCRNLDSRTGLCRDYQRRPLVCRTFICCPAAPNARLLREEIVNSGEDELVRTWFDLRGASGTLILHEGFAPDPRPADYPQTPFFGTQDYRQVKLADICSERLWRKLTDAD